MDRAEPQGGLAGVLGWAGAGLGMAWQGCGQGRRGHVVDRPSKTRPSMANGLQARQVHLGHTRKTDWVVRKERLKSE